MACNMVQDNSVIYGNNNYRYIVEELLYTVNAHQEHLQTIKYLAKRKKPAIVITASCMCSGGRTVNYIKQFLPNKTADILFVGDQAQGTLRRDIQKYAPKHNEEESKVK